ncbi:hypothetical protein RHGRI_015016 [Rhododendron griersonianum]|uniref:Uncharacterized protein n=1 Tax=Rhododendron griersonianum TaxID=479676 RepID=A0AAV6KBQ7_9ERIC|nr:hypothetical protein RHGRI_015016 [Rhododendron griersonianum]
MAKVVMKLTLWIEAAPALVISPGKTSKSPKLETILEELPRLETIPEEDSEEID